MDSFYQLMNGFSTALSGMNLLYCLLGVTLGQLIGVLPGLGPVTGVAVLLPLTFSMPSVSAIIMLCGIYYGAMYGGTITSVLINTPGEAASVITCLDGHPLAKQGRAGVALGVAGLGSFIGGIVSIFGLMFMGPPLAEMALKFGPPEYFALLIMGLTMVIGLLGKSLVKGVISAAFGLCLALIGMDPATGTVRFAFGSPHLLNGIDFVTISMGLFGLTEIMISMEDIVELKNLPKVKGFLPRKGEWKTTMNAILRGTGIGFLIGLIPGTNSVIPAILSYSAEKKLSKDPSRFGNGALEGVAGPETANNSYCGGALIPLLTMGIPSSPTIAIILGAFMIHGVTPGPQLFQTQPNLVWGIIASMFIGNALLLVMNLPMASTWAKIATIPPKLLYPIILIVSIVGAYTINNDLWDVLIMLVFGVIGYFMRKADIPMAPVVLTFVLGRLMESSLIQSLFIFKGDFLKFFTRPISGTLLCLSVIVLIASFIAGLKNRKQMFAADVEM